MSAINLTFPLGFAGASSRVTSGEIIESCKLTAIKTPTLYGVAVKVDNDGAHPIESGDDANSVYGVLLRPFPSSNVLVAGGIVDIKRQGYVVVQTTGADTPVKGGTVYLRVTAGTAGEAVGTFSTVSDSTKTFALTNAHFTGGKDANGLAEIFIAVNK